MSYSKSGDTISFSTTASESYTITFGSETPTLLGDVNNDSAVNVVDALLVAQFYVGLNPSNFEQSRADVNCDGNINVLDAV